MTRPEHDQDREHDAQVVPFPRPAAVETAGAELEPAPQILEGEIVDPPPRAGLPVLRPAGRVVRVVSTRAAPRAASAGRAAGRTAVTIGQGLQSWARRGWSNLTYGDYRRAIEQARAAGDLDRAADWTGRREAAREHRHQVLMDLPKLVVGLGQVTGIALVASAVLLLLLAVAAQLSGAGTFLGVLGGARDTVRWVLAAIPVAATVALVVVPVVLLVAAWREGRRSGRLPAWAISREQRDAETTVVTPLGIAEALAHLGIPKLTEAIRKGWTVEFDTPPTRVNNRGYQTVFSLPMGVTPDMIADKGDVLARNLHRAKTDVWVVAADRPGYVEAWVSDPGSTEKPAPEYPLLRAGDCDVFTAVPLGVSQRGDLIAPPLVAQNLVFGGQMGQGKSNAARVVMLGAALDPLAELWVFVFANNGDFDTYRPRLSRYHKGVDDAVCGAALDSLHELYAEVGRREQRLAELGAKKVTRGLADRYPDLRPVVVLFSECHELFGHDDYGKQAADVATQTLRRARKTGITLLFDTQSARREAIPPKIVELVSINVCFYVKAWRSNDGFLGDGSFAAGIRATELRPGRDRGTAVVAGATAERFEILKWFYVEVDDDTGYDAAAEVIARAVGALHPAVPILGDRPAPVAEPATRDLLEDLADALGTEQVPAARVPALLARLAPRWAPYRRMTGKDLVDQLAALGVKVPSTANRWPVDPVTVREALARRATADLDDDT